MNAYTMKDWTIEGPEGPTVLRSAFTSSGDYIGDEDTAKWLCEERGIRPQRASSDHKVCSIGFCEAEQKWYGWSHRAIFGFGVGSSVKKGDCGYVPTDWDDFLAYAANFWTDEHHQYVTATRGTDDEGRECANVAWEYDDTVPNKKLRGTIAGSVMYPPETWGRGEWTAATLDDAKQMAVDFAESVG